MTNLKPPWHTFGDKLRRKLEQHWYGSQCTLGPGRLWNQVFGALLKSRREMLGKVADAPLPVIVVGNITVGGTGKTPLVIEVVNQLKAWGKRPGVVSRGYGAQVEHPPIQLSLASTADEVGDEPLLIASATQVPVVVDPERSRALRYLATHTDVDVVVSDDGLQHYQLERCFEIAVVDGVRRFGNGKCIPFGPLREPVSRLHEVDMVVVNGGDSGQAQVDIGRHVYSGRVVPKGFRSLHTEQFYGLKQWPKRVKRLMAVAGIGRPERFFETLHDLGCEFDERPYADHHRFTPADFEDLQDRTVVITAKDAVKVHPSWLNDAWVLDIQLALDATFWQHLKVQLQSIGVVQACATETEPN